MSFSQIIIGVSVSVFVVLASENETG